MSRNSLFWAVAIVALIAAIIFRSRVLSEPPTVTSTHIAFITGGSSSFWQLTVNGAKAATNEYNVQLHVETPEGDENIQEQIRILARLDPGKYDGVAISPLDADRQTRAINQFARETNVVTFDSDAPLSERHCYIGTNNYVAGNLAAELISEALPEGGKVVVFLASLAKDNIMLRKQGFEESIKKMVQEGEEPTSPAVEIVSYQIDDGDLTKCTELILQSIKKHPELAGIVGMNGYHGPVMLEVLKKADKLNQIKLVVFDEPEAILQGIEKGTIFATVAQDPYMYGFEAVRWLASLNTRRHEMLRIGHGTLTVRAEVIRKSNLEEFRKRLLERQPEALTDADQGDSSN